MLTPYDLIVTIERPDGTREERPIVTNANDRMQALDLAYHSTKFELVQAGVLANVSVRVA